MSAPSILLVDDDVELVDMLQDYLQQEGFAVTAAHNADDGIAEALSGRHALAVLDVMMPRGSGVKALARIRVDSRLPVLMLTAKGDDADRIVGLELGADDYVAKPCTPRELTARIRAILRRAGVGVEAGAPLQLVAGPLTLFPHQRKAEWNGRPLDLTSTEFSLLEVLARNAGRIVNKEALSEAALGRPLTRFDRSIDVHMSSIRRKLGAMPDGHSWIRTVVRQGYQLVKE